MLFCRAVGYFIRFIKNRDLAAENIATTYVRTRFILDTFPGAIASVVRRADRFGLRLPNNILLLTADLLQNIRGKLSGEYAVQVKSTRRNSRVVSDPAELHSLGII